MSKIEEKNNTVDQETAIADFERWLTIKKIREQKRQENSKFEDVIISAIVDGILTIDENGYITQKMSFTIEDSEKNPVLPELKYMPRIPMKLLNIKLKGVDSSDADKRQIAYMAALTQQNMGLLEKMDTEDHRVAQAIIMYFL